MMMKCFRSVKLVFLVFTFNASIACLNQRQSTGNCKNCTSNPSNSKRSKPELTDANEATGETLKSIARQFDNTGDSESEDENSPDESFVKQLLATHESGNLTSLVDMSYDVKKNPLFQVAKNGMVRPFDVSVFAKDYPDFFTDILKVQKKHGCFTYFNNFITRNYRSDVIHDEPSLRLSQMQYLQIVISYYNIN